jgi:secreted trypsin-like serine protease
MRRAVSTLVFTALIVSGAPVHAITGDWVEDNEHPYVGLVVFYDADGEFLKRCSGALLSSTKFLTAGHCTDMADGAVTARVYFQQDAGANLDLDLGYDPVTLYPIDCAPGTLGTLCATSDELHNYGFDEFGGFPNIRDVGLVILDQPIALPEYGQLPQAAVLDDLATARGTKKTTFTVSGYGLTYNPEEHSVVPFISFRERLMAQSALVNLRSALTDGYNLQTQGNGSGRGGTCGGDSGGPVFLGGPASNRIVAVTSFGLNVLCRGTDFGYRIDQADVLQWIASH